MFLRIWRLLQWSIYRVDNLCMSERPLYQSIYLQNTECIVRLYSNPTSKKTYLLNRECMCLWAKDPERHIYLVDNWCMKSILAYQSIFLFHTLCMEKIQQLIYMFLQCTSHTIHRLYP